MLRQMELTIEIPDEAVQALRMPAPELQAELKKELAAVLYSRGALSLGKAVEMSGVTRAEFEGLLARRRIERPYTVAELDRDLSWAKAEH
jgi:predicted HTH domain antitoxin